MSWGRDTSANKGMMPIPMHSAIERTSHSYYSTIAIAVIVPDGEILTPAQVSAPPMTWTFSICSIVESLQRLAHIDSFLPKSRTVT